MALFTERHGMRTPVERTSNITVKMYYFVESGLLYTLTSAKVLERVLEHSTLTPEVETAIQSVKEKGLKDLLEEAVTLFKQPDPAFRNDVVEKLWDAFERLKTYLLHHTG